MKIFVQAKAGSKYEKVEKINPTLFRVAVKERPQKGKANEAIQKAIAKQLGIPKIGVKLKSGATAKRKVFEVLDWSY